jgi:hypothetical protein
MFGKAMTIFIKKSSHIKIALRDISDFKPRCLTPFYYLTSPIQISYNAVNQSRPKEFIHIHSSARFSAAQGNVT